MPSGSAVKQVLVLGSPSCYTDVMVGCMLPATRCTTRLGRGTYTHVPVIRLTLNPSSSPILRAWNRQSLPDSGWLKQARDFFIFQFFLFSYLNDINDLTVWNFLLIVLVKYHLMQKLYQKWTLRVHFQYLHF